jgi:hypothetical protein
MTNRLTILCALLCLVISCKKENQKSCWQAYDPAGANVPSLQLCDKTKAEAEAAQPGYWFYNAADELYCWRIQGSSAGSADIYKKNMPQAIAEKYKSTYGGTYTKVSCSSFCNWQIYEKRKSKLTGTFSPVRVLSETLLSADSCSKLFEGRVVVYSETADSIITREFIKTFE